MAGLQNDRIAETDGRIAETTALLQFYDPAILQFI
jgi:hypothetical protein